MTTIARYAFMLVDVCKESCHTLLARHPKKLLDSNLLVTVIRHYIGQSTQTAWHHQQRCVLQDGTDIRLISSSW